MDVYREIIGNVGLAIEIVGVFVIVVGVVYAGGHFLLKRLPDPNANYQRLRHDLARSILLGLEFLIAGDIIRTVAVTPTLESVAVLGLIVLVRTFLMIALHLEVEGQWPWQKPRAEDTRPPAGPQG
jgi:uncharacterized membrane protein